MMMNTNEAESRVVVACGSIVMCMVAQAANYSPGQMQYESFAMCVRTRRYLMRFLGHWFKALCRRDLRCKSLEQTG